MAFGATPVDANNIPIGSIYVPNSAIRVLRGGSEYTDGSSNVSAAAAFTLEPGWKASYVAAFIVVGGAGDIFQMTGSGTKTIELTRIQISPINGTAAANSMKLVRRSSADTGGTTQAVTMLPLDSNDSAATAVMTAYTAVPTQGSLVGDIRDIETAGPIAGTYLIDWVFGVNGSKAPTLRGASQFFALIAGAATTWAVVVEWTEK